MSHPIAWTYGESDPALMLWTAAVERFGLTWPRRDARVLELGCAETDFLTRLTRQNPGLDVTGVDARAEGHSGIPGGAFVQGDAAHADLFEPESFDVVVMLGALEHFGLGFYGDPIDEAGDVKTMWNVTRWLRPGGWVYFDVPCNPTYSVSDNRHFRTYAPASVDARLLVEGLVERARGYSDCEPHAGTWLEGPPTDHKVPYHFVAVVADRPAGAGHS